MRLAALLYLKNPIKDAILYSLDPAETNMNNFRSHQMINGTLYLLRPISTKNGTGESFRLTGDPFNYYYCAPYN